jgi:SAM-dependent methyltransferase
MQSERIFTVALSDVVGGGNPELVAKEILSLLENHISLAAVRSILDVGCGCGRIAAGLTQHLSPLANYTGVDILPGLVKFCRRLITPRYPEFRFFLLEANNQTYDGWRQKGGIVDLTHLSEAMPAGTADLALAISLFSHLNYAPAVEILRAIERMLATGGQAFITMFVVDAEARLNIENGSTGIRFAHRTPSGELFAEKLEDPTFAVGYEMEKMDDLVRCAGLRRERWIRGYWSQGNSGETFQDALVLRKP